MIKLRLKPTTRLQNRQLLWPWFVCASILLLAILPQMGTSYDAPEVVIGALGGVWAFAFFLHSNHKEDAKFMKELFEFFNGRYDKQNNDLQKWLEQEGEFTNEQKLAFIDYFNFCAEESVFQRLGYIYDEVWESWQHGMRQYGRDPRVAALWKEQRKTKSYYDFEFPIDEENA